MKKFIYISFAALIALVSCSKDLIPEDQTVNTRRDVTISISLAQTKATINDSGSGDASFAWDDNDEIGVVVGGARLAKFTLTEKDGEKAKFTGTLEAGEKLESGDKIAYPYVEEDFQGGVFEVSFPDEYTINKPNDFRLRWSGELVANGEGGYMTDLDHTSGIFRVTYSAIPEETQEVRLIQGEKTVTLKLGAEFDKEPEEEGKGVSFYFPVEAGTQSGFTVALSDGENVIPGTERSSSKSVTYELGTIYRTPMITLNVYKMVTSTDTDVLTAGDYILVYPSGTTYRVFSFQKTMENAEVAAAQAGNTHGLDALLRMSSSLYKTVIKDNCVDVEGAANAESLILTPDQEKNTVLSVTMNDADHSWDLVDGKVTLAATTEKNSYSINVDHTVVTVDGSADVVAAFNAPGLVDAAKKLRGTDIPVDFEYLIDFAVSQAQAKGISFTADEVDRLKTGFEHLTKLAQTMVSQHPEVFGQGTTLMDIDLDTKVLDVFSRYYDNASELSWALSSEKRFGLATLGYYAGNEGFTFNVGLPQAGWFNRLEASLKGTKAECEAYWAAFDNDYDIMHIENFFQRASHRALAELSDDTYLMLQQMANAGKFSAIGSVYGEYAKRFNDELEPVYLFKKVE